MEWIGLEKDFSIYINFDVFSEIKKAFKLSKMTLTASQGIFRVSSCATWHLTPTPRLQKVEKKLDFGADFQANKKKNVGVSKNRGTPKWMGKPY